MRRRFIDPSGTVSEIEVDQAEDRLIVRSIQDAEPVLRDVERLRQAHGGKLMGGQVWHVARIPAVLLEQWLIEAGVDRSDRDAVSEVIRKKLLSGEFSRLRVADGSY